MTYQVWQPKHKVSKVSNIGHSTEKAILQKIYFVKEMISNIICLVGILSFANRLQISHCVNTLEVLKKLPEVIEAWETFYINKSKEDIIINIQQCFNIFHGRKWNEQIIESPYLCISQGNGPNELFMGTLVKRKCAGRGEGRPPHSRPSMSGDGPRYRITPFLYQHFLFPFFF